MAMNITHKTQFRNGAADKKSYSNNSYGAKINPEISYAIRRQREVSGIDYLKACQPTKSSVLGEKRGNVNSLPNVSFDGYLPHFSISSQLKTDKNYVRRSKKFDKFGTLNRSKSSASLSLSSRRFSTPAQSTPHNVVVTDLTCLQLADTLFSSDISSSLGLTGQTSNKLRYTNFPGENHNLIFESEKNALKNARQSEKTALPLPNLKSTGHSRPDSGNGLRKQNNLEITVISKKENQRPNSSNTVKKMFQSSVLNDKEELNPKSILKQNITIDSNNELGRKIPKYRTISERIPKKNACIETSRCITVRASKIGIQSRNSQVKPCFLEFGDKDKRSVRFNISHEIFEYVPHEPVRL